MKNELSQALLLRCLRRLGELAAAEKITLEICLYGGAAMMLAYNRRAITRDVDAVVIPSETGRRLARAVAREFSLHEEWLNDEVRIYLGTKGRTRLLREFSDHPGLRISVPTAGYLLAMKALACRDPLPGHAGDHEDLRFLIRKMRIRSVRQIQEHIDRYFENDAIPPKNQRVLEKLIHDSLHEHNPTSNGKTAHGG